MKRFPWELGYRSIAPTSAHFPLSPTLLWIIFWLKGGQGSDFITISANLTVVQGLLLISMILPEDIRDLANKLEVTL